MNARKGTAVLNLGTANREPFTAPRSMVTKKCAYLGQPGSGKSYAAMKAAEEMLGASAQVVAIDPIGVWWGLRLHADGESPGIDIPIFGGLRGDIPLTPTSGALVADVIVDRRLSVVLDVSQFEHDAEKARFVTAFAKRFYWRMKEAPAPVHLFLEEAHEFVPQQMNTGEDPMMLHEFRKIQKHGRNYGIGMSLVSQRTAEVNKSVLWLTEIMFAFQNTAAPDRKVVLDWTAQADKAAAKELDALLPTLGVGEAYVSSPAFLRFKGRVKIGQRSTYDSSSTPDFENEDRAPARDLEPLDLGALTTAMAATAEEQKANDPKALKARIAELERELAGCGPTCDHEPIIEQLQAAIADKEAAREAAVLEAYKATRVMTDVIGVLKAQAIDTLQQTVDQLLTGTNSREADAAEAFNRYLPEALALRPSQFIGTHEQDRPQPTAFVARVKAAQADEGAGKRSAGQQALLDAAARLLAAHIETPTRSQVAAFGGRSPTSSATERAYGALVREGLLEIPSAGCVKLTREGARVAAKVHQAATLTEYLDNWVALLGSGADAKLFRAMRARRSRTTVTREQLANEAGISSTSSATERAYAWLISLGLFQIAGKGAVAPGPTMYPEGLR